MKLGVCVLMLLAATGCAARGSGPASRSSAASPVDAQVGTLLAEFIARGRAAAAEARPPERAPVLHAEAHDPRLAAAIAAASAWPSPETLRQAADEYRRLGIADRAHAYLQQALRLDSRDAATYDALARLWRDSGLPALALADAHRAAYYAPSSPIVHNTLGTVFQALGRRRDARAQYERALALDPAAAYARNNLCYSWLLDGQAAKAAAACVEALRLDPDLPAARNNLALAYAAQGKVDAARALFDAAGDPAAAAYNLGIVHMARRSYTDAVSAFAAAQQVRPSSRAAAERVAQASRLAREGVGE